MHVQEYQMLLNFPTLDCIVPVFNRMSMQGLQSNTCNSISDVMAWAFVVFVYKDVRKSMTVNYRYNLNILLGLRMFIWIKTKKCWIIW